MLDKKEEEGEWQRRTVGRYPDRFAPATMPVTAGKNTENTCIYRGAGEQGEQGEEEEEE